MVAFGMNKNLQPDTVKSAFINSKAKIFDNPPFKQK